MYNRSHIFICPADKTAVQQESWIGHIGRQMVRPAVPRQTLASQLSHMDPGPPICGACRTSLLLLLLSSLRSSGLLL